MAEIMYKLSIQNLRLSVRFNHVIFPLSMLDFARSLSERGFQLKTELPRPDTKSLGRLTYNGPLAVKEQSIVDVNSERQFIGVMGADPEILLATFNEVLETLRMEEQNGGPLKSWFYELQCRLECTMMDAKKKKKRDRRCELIEEKLGFPVARRGIRISSDTGADSPNYFEFAVEPIIGKEGRSYDCTLLFRDQEFTNVSEFLADMNERAGAIIEHCLE